MPKRLARACHAGPNLVFGDGLGRALNRADKVGELVAHGVIAGQKLKFAFRGIDGRITLFSGVALCGAAVADASVLGRRDLVDGHGCRLALDLRGEQVVGNLGVVEGDEGIAVGSKDHAGAIDGAVAELLCLAIQKATGADDLPGRTEQLDHGLDGVDADVHKAARGHVAVEDVGLLAGEDLVVARRVFTKVQMRAADASELCDVVLAGVEGRIVQGAHGLHGNDARRLGGGKDLLGLARVSAEGFFDQDMLAARDAGKCLVVMERVGAPDIDGIDIGRCGERLERRERLHAAVLAREGLRALGVAREGAHKLGGGVLVEDLDEVVGDHRGSDGGKAKHGFLRW